MMKKRVQLASMCAGILLVVSVLAGCVNFNKSYPEKRYFVLDVTRSQPAQKGGGNIVLRVRKCDVSARYEGRGLVYRTGEFTYESDFYNKFFVSPALLVTEEIRKWLEDSGLFSHVTDTVGYVEEDYILQGEVMALYGDLRDTSPARSVVEIQFAMIRVGSSEPRVVFTKLYSEDIALSSTTPDAVAEGMNRALESILMALEADLEQQSNWGY